MLEGLYRIRYETPAGERTGVSIFQAGQIVGGGQHLYCVGTYEVNGTKFSGEILARRHAKTAETSPLAGFDQVKLRLEGTVTDTYGQLTATVIGCADVPPMHGSILRISDV